MAVMTGIFIFSVLPHYIKDRRLASGLLIIMILFLPLTNIYLFHKRTVAQDTGRGSFPYNVPAYLEQGEDEALRWIAEKTSHGEVILSGYNIGNYIPAYANRRVFLGTGHRQSGSMRELRWSTASTRQETSRSSTMR
jgi:hypothetical protein